MFGNKCVSLSGLLVCVLLGIAQAQADEIKVAVAANFTAPMEQIATLFAKDTGHKAVLSFGATGALYAQISNGAPFALFLSADDKTTARLAAEGKAVASSEFTYATGKLVLWSQDPDLVDNAGKILTSAKIRHVAIANPDTAPYGKAAVDVMTTLGLYDMIKPKLVIGDNISQTFQFVSTGNAELGFVAQSQVFFDGKIQKGSAWIVPDDRYAPIHQNAILTNLGADNAAAQTLLQYLQSAKAKAVIESFGYAI